MILCVIPARGGSKGLPGKNIRPILGKPLIGYTIEAAQNEKILNRIVVSTEDPDIAKVSKSFGVQVIDRPLEMATDKANIDGALQHSVRTIEDEGEIVDIVVWLKANVPIRKEGVIGKVVEKLIDSEADSVITIKKAESPVEMACKLDGENLVPYTGDAPTFPGRQDYPEAYFHSGAIYAIKRSALMRDKIQGDSADYFLGDKKQGYLVSEYPYNIEIDDEKDAIISELFLQEELAKKVNRDHD
jgi:CMP-N-acetylneuraminic acid synthetase|tara:strand:+ start:3467 stop:4198 length:732 start_codon:yes stop_codon:yes gene_type:complete